MIRVYNEIHESSMLEIVREHNIDIERYKYIHYLVSAECIVFHPVHDLARVIHPSFRQVGHG